MADRYSIWTVHYAMAVQIRDVEQRLPIAPMMKKKRTEVRFCGSCRSVGLLLALPGL